MQRGQFVTAGAIGCGRLIRHQREAEDMHHPCDDVELHGLGRIHRSRGVKVSKTVVGPGCTREAEEVGSLCCAVPRSAGDQLLLVIVHESSLGEHEGPDALHRGPRGKYCVDQRPAEPST